MERLVGGGRGLAHHGGDTWMVRGAMPGEVVLARPSGRRQGVVEADCLEVVRDPHPARHPQPCPHAPLCGGCDWPHVLPAAEARLKAEVAAAAAGDPALAMALASAPVWDSPPAYRLRARLHWDPESRVLGFFRPKSWRAVDIPGCRILSPRLMSALPRLAASLADRCPQPVDVEWLEDLEGAAAVAALREGRATPAPLAPEWLPPPSESAGPVDGFHLLTRSGTVRSGWGSGSVTMGLVVPLRVPVGAFFQVNRHLARRLFNRVGELAGSGQEPAWDLHGGVGFLAAAVLAHGPRPVQVVEPFRPAAHAAAENLPDAAVAARTAEAFLSRRRRLPRAALVLVDPPRAGLSPTLRRRLAGWHPDRILMLACDPATWARDTRFLLDRGYRLSQLELVDLFPSTHHAEVLALLEAA